jgi:hypothetical protein
MIKEKINGVTHYLCYKYSVLDGFKNKIDPEIISNPFNLEFLTYSEMKKRGDTSVISYDELIEGYKRYKLLDARDSN